MKYWNNEFRIDFNGISERAWTGSCVSRSSVGSGECVVGNKFEPGQMPLLFVITAKLVLYRFAQTLGRREKKKVKMKKYWNVKNPTETSTTYVGTYIEAGRKSWNIRKCNIPHNPTGDVLVLASRSIPGKRNQLQERYR